jgi:hypothetical protein
VRIIEVYQIQNCDLLFAICYLLFVFLGMLHQLTEIYHTAIHQWKPLGAEGIQQKSALFSNILLRQSQTEEVPSSHSRSIAIFSS